MAVDNYEKVLWTIQRIIENISDDAWMEAEAANSMLWQALDEIDSIVLDALNG